MGVVHMALALDEMGVTLDALMRGYLVAGGADIRPPDFTQEFGKKYYMRPGSPAWQAAIALVIYWNLDRMMDEGYFREED